MMILNKRFMRGFTLVEVVVVVAIIGILAAIAIPSYKTYFLDSYRQEAKTELMRLSQEEEKWRANHLSYANENETDGTTTFTLTDSIYYDYAISGVDASNYTITAMPLGNQTADPCGTLTITSTGIITASGCSAP